MEDDNYYRQMQVGGFSKNGYTSSPLDGKWFLMFSPKDEHPKSAGWKFHLSVAGEDVARAWNIVVDELAKDKMNDKAAWHSAKVANPDVAKRISKSDHHNPGKTIVIYTDAKITPEHYQDLLQRIEHRLRAAGIRPGVNVDGDRQVPGSAYMFYRNENLAGEYNEAANNRGITVSRQYNPEKEKDPYANFKVEPLWQVASWPWKTAETDDGTPITRVKVEDREEAREKIRTLKNMGMKAIIAKSTELGLTVRLEGDEMKPIEKARKELWQVAQWPWLENETKDGAPIMRVKADDKAKQQAAIEILQGLGMIAFKHPSRFLGDTVRIQGAEMAQIKKTQKVINEPHMLRNGKLRPMGGPA